MKMEWIFVLVVAASVIGVALGMFLKRRLSEARLADASKAAAQIVSYNFV